MKNKANSRKEADLASVSGGGWLADANVTGVVNTTVTDDDVTNNGHGNINIGKGSGTEADIINTGSISGLG